MATRVVAGAAALGLAVAVAVLGVSAATGRDPRPLPVIGGDTEDASSPSSPASVEYRVEGDLDALDGEEHAWELGRDVDLDRVAALAEALGLPGTVAEIGSGWEVVEGNRRLEVERQPGLPWSYSVGSPPSDGEIVCAMPACPPGTACPQVCPPGDEPVAMPMPTDLPSAEEAERLARPVVAAGGVDLKGAALRVDDLTRAWMVNVDPEVGGLPTVGMGSAVTVGANGTIEYAGGWMGRPERGDLYPLVGTPAALAGLSSERSMPTADGREPATACLDCPGIEPVVVTITGVQLGLEWAPAFNGAGGWLVPAYLFETAEGAAGPDLVTLAVSDAHLVSPDEPRPMPEPQPGPQPGPEPTPAPAPDPVPVPAPEPGPVPPRAGCLTSPGGDDGSPSLEVCQTGPARAGEPVAFELVASDAGSGIRDDCGSPVVVFGDEGETAVCGIGCLSLADGPGRLRKTFTHVYAEPGTYRASFSLFGCGPESGLVGEVNLQVVVAA